MAELALLVVFPLLMAFAGASDLLTMTIPNRLSVALVAVFPILAMLAGMTGADLLLHAAAGALVLGLTFGCFALGWIGGGDAKLAAATALWLGFETLPDYLMLAAIAGGALTLSVLVLRIAPLPRSAEGWTWLARLRDRKAGVPYGIALAAAALTVYPHSQIWIDAIAR